MRKNKLFEFTITILIICSTLQAGPKKSGFDHFITKEGNQLMEGDQVYRFISFNIPNLNFVEDEMQFERSHPYGLPTEYEIRDALESVKQMGGRVVRSYTIPVRKQNEGPEVPKYVTAPGEFNEEAFKCMDQMLATANEVGIRLIVPLLNNWKWMGGRPQYAAFRGKTSDEFWSDPQLIADFKKTIKYVLNRKNTITGVKYKNDKAILCWETGNELQSPQEWTHQIMEYIKSIDKNHLVMDGRSDPVITAAVLNDPASDIITSHHYETDPQEMVDHIRQSAQKVKQTDKAYVIGEFGFLGTPAIEQIIDEIMVHQEIAGGLIWSLRYHREEGGFYWHSEPLGFGIYKAYHWPGFRSGEEYDETNLLNLMREKAYAIQNKEVPGITAPKAPQLLPIENVADISWQGSVGAECYDLWRAKQKNGEWTKIAESVSDAAVQYYPLYHDNSAQIGESYYYKIVAKNKAGKSTPSNIVGPVQVETQALVDNMEDFMKMYHTTGNIKMATQNDRKFKEDLYRVAVDSSSQITYFVPGHIKNFKIYLFSQKEGEIIAITASQQGDNYVNIGTDSKNYFEGEGDYGYWYPILYEQQEKLSNKSYLSLEFKEKAQISRVEIYYE